MPQLKATSSWLKAIAPQALRADSAARKTQVDRENNRLNGYVVAQEGLFKTPGRGQFDKNSLKAMIDLMKQNANGTKSRFTHPTLSSDGLGKFLGRAHDPWLSSVLVERNGEMVKLSAVRANLHFNQTALEPSPDGGKPLGQYIMDLAETDPDALSSSVVIEADEEAVLDPKTKKQVYDENGEPMAPIWRPRAIHASDIVDTGDAVDGLLAAQLSIAGLPDSLVRQASELLNQAFPGEPRDVVRARLNCWLDSYLSYRFGEEEEVPEIITCTDTAPSTIKPMSKELADCLILQHEAALNR